MAGLGCGGNSRVGLGTGLSEGQSVALVQEALDLGVNLLDTAAAYGTEAVVGKAIKGRPRDSVVISTKSHVSVDGRPLSGAQVVANLETSLRQLDTDYVDVFHLHGLAPKAYDHDARHRLGRAVGRATVGVARKGILIPALDRNPVGLVGGNRQVGQAL